MYFLLSFIKSSPQNISFLQYVSNLQQLVQWYNKLKQTVLEVELPLIRTELESVDLQLTRAESELTWQDPDCWSFICTIKDFVHDLACRVSRAKENCEVIQSMMKGWNKQAMFCRKDNKKGSLIQLEDRVDRVNKKYNSMRKDGDSIHKLVQVCMAGFMIIFTLIYYRFFFMYTCCCFTVSKCQKYDIIGMVPKPFKVL